MMRVQKDMQNKAQMFRRAVVCAVLLLAGCASGPGGGIYVPAGERPQAPKPPLTDGAASQPMNRRYGAKANSRLNRNHNSQQACPGTANLVIRCLLRQRAW